MVEVFSEETMVDSSSFVLLEQPPTASRRTLREIKKLFFINKFTPLVSYKKILAYKKFYNYTLTSELFTKGTTWNGNQYAKVLASNDYKEAAYALQESGYATDPDYPEKLIRLIEQYDLNQYDR